MIKASRLAVTASAVFFYGSAALAQTSGAVTNHAFAIGKGPGSSYTSLLCGSAQLAVGQSAADPICRTVSGDVTLGADGVTAIGASKVTNAMLAGSIAASKLVGTDIATVGTITYGTWNGTAIAVANGGTGATTAANARTNLGVAIGTNVQAWDADLDCIAALAGTGILRRTGTGTCSNGTVVTAAEGGIGATNIASLTHKAVPTSADLVLIADSAASNAYKYATISELLSSIVVGVSSFNGLTGAVVGVSSFNGQTGAITLVTPPQGRVTLTSGVPVTASDVVGATTVYYTPDIGNVIPIWDGSNMILTPFTELSLVLDSNTGHSNYQQVGLMYDYWVCNDAGTIRLGTAANWQSNTNRGTGGALQNELQMVNGIWINKNALTLRFGSASGNTVAFAANRCTLVGSGLMTANGVTEDSYAKRFTSNAYNTASRPMRILEATSSWVYSTTPYRQANGLTTNQLSYVRSLTGGRARARLSVTASSSISPTNISIAIGLDSATVPAAGSLFPLGNVSVSSTLIQATADYSDFAGLGFHTLTWLEQGGGGTTTWYGSLGGALQSGMVGEVDN